MTTAFNWFLRKMCLNAIFIAILPAPEEPVMAMMGYFLDTIYLWLICIVLNLLGLILICQRYPNILPSVGWMPCVMA